MMGYRSIIDDWIDEGKAEAARTLVRHALQKRFGTVIPPVDAWLQNASFEQCDRLMQRALETASLQEINLEQLSRETSRTHAGGTPNAFRRQS